MLFQDRSNWVELAAIAAGTTILAITLVHQRQLLEKPVSRPKRLTFRVDNIPAGHTPQIFLDNVRSTAEQIPILQEAVSTLVQHSLVPKNSRVQCATVSIVTSLAENDLCNQMNRSGNNPRYEYTCKFDGITPLFQDDNADVE